MPKSNGLSKESSIYHYTLLKRYNLTTWLSLFFWIPPVTLAIWLIIRYQDSGLWSLILVAVLCPMTARLTVSMLVQSPLDIHLTGWGWQLSGPWFGYWPLSYTSYQTVKRIHQHQTFIGLVIGAMMIPWTSEPIWIAFSSVHIYLSVLRGWVVLRVRSKDVRAVIRIEKSNTSLYLP